ncbi:MAG: selenide, water dikinase SelD [Deltaproteobacteria bacterium]|nr:selenide, water dikinase SelD [Deltaproteobacteria bacterium]
MEIKLTETVQKGGCAAKLPAGELSRVLKSLELSRPKELVEGAETLDDAALWDLHDGRLLIQTLDFFTPIVDDPFDFGAIAATNALSDIYAMGGEPKTAMTILAFPMKTIPLEILGELMRGAVSKIEEAGACLVGGHSLDDETLKLGFSVSGFVEKGKEWRNSGLKVGDVLILTKPLGTGTLSSAIKNKQAEAAWIAGAKASMKTLNLLPELLRTIDVHAATDVTGFGLAGHLLQMARASGVSIEVNVSALPVLDGAMTCLERKILNRAHKTNNDYVKDFVSYDGVTAAQRWLTVDPQTSGGLIVAVREQDAGAVLDRVRSRFPCSAIIGRVVPPVVSAIHFV